MSASIVYVCEAGVAVSRKLATSANINTVLAQLMANPANHDKEIVVLSPTPAPTSPKLWFARLFWYETNVLTGAVIGWLSCAASGLGRGSALSGVYCTLADTLQ